MSLDFLRNYQVFSFEQLAKKVQGKEGLPILEEAGVGISLASLSRPIGITNTLQGVEFCFKHSNDESSAYSITNPEPIYRCYTHQKSIIFINKEQISKFLIIVGEANDNDKCEHFSNICNRLKELLGNQGFSEIADSDHFIDEIEPCYYIYDFNKNDDLNLNNVVRLLKDSNDINYSKESYYLSNQAIDVLIYIGDACQHGWHFRQNTQVLGIDSLRSFLLQSLITIPCIVDFSNNRFCSNANSHEILTPRKINAPAIEIHMQNIYGKALSFIEKYNGIPFSSYYIGSICIIPPIVSRMLYEVFIENLLNVPDYPSVEILSELIKQSKIYLRKNIQTLKNVPDNGDEKGNVYWNTAFGLSHGDTKYKFSADEATKKKEVDDVVGRLTDIDDILEYVEKSGASQKIKPVKRITGVVRSYLLHSEDPYIERTIFSHLLTKITQNRANFTRNIKTINRHLEHLKEQHPTVTDFRIIVPNTNLVRDDLYRVFGQKGITIQTFNKVLLRHSKDFHRLNESIEAPAINVEPIIESVAREYDLRRLKGEYERGNQQFIADFIEEPHKHILVIVGEASFGKTHFLTQVCQTEFAQLTMESGLTRTLLFITPKDCSAFGGILDERKALINFVHHRLSSYSLSERHVEILLREGLIIPVFDGLDEICTQCKLDAEVIIHNFKGIMGSENGQIYKVIFSSRTAYWDTFFPEKRADDEMIVYRIKGFSDEQIYDYIDKRASLSGDQSFDIEKAKEEVRHIIKRLNIHGELSPLVLEIIFDAYRHNNDGKNEGGTFDFSQYNERTGDFVNDEWLYLITNICSRENNKMNSPMTLSEHLSYLADIAIHFETFTSKEIRECFEKFIDTHNISINPAVLISHPLFKVIHGTDKLAFRHPVIKNYLRFHSIKNEIEDQFIAPKPFFTDAYSSDDFFKSLINKEIFNQHPIDEKELFEIIQLLIFLDPARPLNAQIKETNPLLGFDLMESYFKFKAFSVHDRSLKAFRHIFKVKNNVIRDVHFKHTISRIDFSIKHFENCIFGPQFSFDHCQMGDVSFKNCYFVSDFSLVNCGKKDRIRIEEFKSLNMDFEAVMKSKYDILFIKQKNIEDIKQYLKQILSKFVDRNNTLSEINQTDLIYDSQDYMVIVKELYKEPSESILHIPSRGRVRIKGDYKQEIMKFINHGLASNRINTLVNNIIMELR